MQMFHKFHTTIDPNFFCNFQYYPALKTSIQSFIAYKHHITLPLENKYVKSV